MSPEEAREVLELFQEEQELRQRFEEEGKTMPSIKDMAEGLNVEPERVAALLESVRQQKANEVAVESQPKRTSSPRIGLAIVMIFAGLAVLMFILVAMFSVSRVEVESPAPTPVETTTDAATDAPVPTPD